MKTELSNKNYTILITGAFLSLAALALVIGWNKLWFLTDDAFIAFRYVSSSILGYGYTWNPPPFRPVEGYTSFLWVIILEYVWRLFGILPPKSANFISLILSMMTLMITTLAVLRMQLRSKFEKYRQLILLAILIGLVTNRTFITWSSSGLETALFNFCFFLWIYLLVFAKRREHFWYFGVSLSAALVYLSRPDGILIGVATVFLFMILFINQARKRTINNNLFLFISPLLIPLIHLFWRNSYYNEWLPNTYYAKHIAAWPESGIRYLASFILEYGLWVWIIIFLWVLVKSFKSKSDNNKIISYWLFHYLHEKFLENDKNLNRWLSNAVAVCVVLLHIGYYTFIIGGDHFEWRIYSYTIPLLYISFFFFLNYLNLKLSHAIATTLTFFFFSLLIPWTHYNSTSKIKHIEIADSVTETISDKLPVVFYPLTRPFDELQRWLIEHHVCVRRIEHKLFCELQMRNYPDRLTEIPTTAGSHPVASFSTVGVLGWVLPSVAIIDEYGLNNYIIARNAPPPGKGRRMAHDRYPPDNYIQTFVPNVGLLRLKQFPLSQKRDLVTLKQFQFAQRPLAYELTPKRISALEKYWEDKIVHGMDVPLPSFVILPDK